MNEYIVEDEDLTQFEDTEDAPMVSAEKMDINNYSLPFYIVFVELPP